MKFLELARKSRRHLSGRAFRYLRRTGSVFESGPEIVGRWPGFHNEGSAVIGAKCLFRAPRIPQQIAVLNGAVLRIGRNAFFNEGVNICASVSVTIGDHAKIGDMVYIYDTDFHEVSPDAGVRKAKVEIGNNVWIGANSMILAGASIGDHSVIGAGSIVTGSIPPRCVAAGRPARVIRTFDAPDGWHRN